MKAVLYNEYGGPEVLQYLDVADPVAGPGEVLVRLQAAGVAPFDWKLRAGMLQQHFTIAFPKIPGRDGSGIVVAIGDDVSGVAVGDAVCLTARHFQQGTYAGMIAVAAADIVPRPDGLSPEQAVSVLNAGMNAYGCAVTVGHVQPSERVLVHAGAGAIGGLLIQICRHLGAEVVATCSAQNRDYVLGLGAAEAIAYDSQDFTTLLRDMDLVFDLVGGDVHERSYAVLRKGGRIIYLNALPFTNRGEEYGVAVQFGMIPDNPAIMRDVLDLAASGIIIPQIAALMPLSQAAEAHRRLAEGKISRGRIVLAIDPEP